MNFIFAVHNHQPVGNFDHVLDDAYKRAYEPFLKMLSGHPSMKFSLHTSGYLLDWLCSEHPEYIETLKGMVERGQVDLMGGGYYEPVLAVIPREDRLGQLKMMSERLWGLFGVRPRGIWLAERVWDPTLPATFDEAGIEYVVVDDFHFVKSGLDADSLFGYYVTEEMGSTVKVFSGNERLRYLIPFEPVESFDEYMRAASWSLDKGDKGGKDGTGGERAVAVFADDGEKFGIWPGTNALVYRDGWLKSFLQTVEGSGGLITPVTFSEYIDTEEPLGRVYLPTTSYMEMGEWALPAEASSEFAALKEELATGVDSNRTKRFLQGGAWRNFFSKYAESNWMHKRMLSVSRTLDNAKGPGGNAREEARRHLYMAQCNDAYWHGIFGGLYLPHLRTGIYEHILKAEALTAGPVCEQSDTSGVEVISGDFDADTHDEILIRTNKLNIFMSPRRGGTIVELDYRPAAVNLTNTLTRRLEGYHEKLTTPVASSEGAAKSIHHRIPSKEEGLDKFLMFDSVERASLRDRFIKRDETLDSFIASSGDDETGDFCDSPYSIRVKDKGVELTRKGSVDGQSVLVTKEVAISSSGSFSVDYRLDGGSGGLPDGSLGVEFNLCLPGCDGPACYYELKAKTMGKTKGDTLGLGSTAEMPGVETTSLVDGHGKVKVHFAFSSPVTFWRYPVETVSLSEGGFERNYQGSCLVFLFPLQAVGRDVTGFSIDVRVEAFCPG